MKKIKKPIILIAVIFYILICMNTKVKALESLGTGGIRINVSGSLGWLGNVHYNMGLPNTKAFCVQHGQTLKSYYMEPNKAKTTFRVTKKIKINGDEAEWWELNTGKYNRVKNDLNLKMAYIAAQPSPGTNHDVKPPIYSEKQKAIYQIFGTWYGSLGMTPDIGINGDQMQSPSIIANAENYKNQWKSQGNASITSNTNIGNIQKEVYISAGREYIKVGPINLNYYGRYSRVTVENQNGNTISVRYGRYEGNTLRIYDDINSASISNQDFYIMIDTSQNISTIKFKATVSANKSNIQAEINIMQNEQPKGRQNWIAVEGYGNTVPTEANIEIGPIELLGDLIINKIDTNSQNPLAKVGFKLYYKNTNQYVQSANNGGVATYTNDINSAQEFFTDNNGILKIEKLKMGQYIIYETKNPNQGYDNITAPVNVQNVQINKPKTEVTIENKRKYISLSGIVWEDIGDGKQTFRNNLYGKEDEIVKGITVQLLQDGKEIMKTTTDENGKYIFKNVEIDKIPNYYISFKYNGMNYQCVSEKLSQKSGSKAKEGEEREIFNNRFTEIKNAEAIGKNGEKTAIEYNKNNKEYTSTLDLGKEEKDGKKPYYGVYEKYIIEANTYKAYNGYLDKIKTPDEIRKNDIKEITDINLGIYLREQPNASLIKDLNNVKVSLKRETHTYSYRERFNNSKAYTEGKELRYLEPQIKFQGKYSEMTYTRPIYASDITYEGTDELTVKVIYEIEIINKTTNLKMKIPEIYDYYDSKYEFKKIGRGIDENGNVIEDASIKTTEIDNENNYKYIQISTNIIVEPQKEEKIYIELEVSKDRIAEILDGNKEIKLDNIAEIGRYGTLDSNGKVYAGIDENSEPGNANPIDPTTYEDDTDKAPGLSLILQKNARKVTGKVFLDNIETSKDPTTIMAGEERKGNGKYDNGEKGIKEVEVKLVYANAPNEVVKVYDEESKTLTKDAVVETDSNGIFEISGFIPGEYLIKYIWGNSEYKVQEYKGTIIDENIWNKNGENKEWYKEIEPRFSDAIDNYEIRENIDNQTKKIMNSNMQIINEYKEGSKLIQEDGTEQELIRKMDSTTQDFKINIEYSNENSDVKDEFEKNSDGSLKLDSKGNLISRDEFKNTIKNVDLGIVERPRQQVNLEKHIKEVKITLSNGEILVNAKVEKGPDGNYQLAEKIPYTVYLPRTNTTEGALKIEIDQELIEGAKIDVTYEITIKNISELEYISEEYYKFGKPTGDLVKLKPSIIDYLDENLIITDKETSDKWKKLSLNDKKELFENGSLDKNLQKYIEKLKGIQTYISKNSLGINEETKIELVASSLLSGNYKIILSNKTEVIEIDKTGGRTPTPIPGNFNPSTNEPKEPDSDNSEEIIILPPTGLSKNTMIYIILGVSTLGILATGIILIKKFVMKK